MNEELMQEIKSTLPWIIVAAIAVGGYYGVKDYLQGRRTAASAALVNAYTTEEFEENVAKWGSSDAGGALKLKLAKKYYDDGRYDEALAQYEALAKAAPDGFAQIPAVGKAQCLEAQGKHDEALAAYGLVAADDKSPFALTAKLGQARVTCLKGDKEKALKDLEALKESVKGEELSKARVEAVEDTVKRYTVAAK